MGFNSRFKGLSRIHLRIKVTERVAVLRSSVTLFNFILEYRTACQKEIFLHLLWKIFLHWMRRQFMDFRLCSKQKYLNSLFHASAAKQMRTALFWVITQRILVISNFFYSCPPDVGTDKLSRNVRNKLPLIAA